MKLFCMDVHISIIADFKTIFPDVEVVDWCLSGHHHIMERDQDCPDVINPITWRHIDQSMIADFQKRYDSFLAGFDGFIVGYASAFAMLYEKYNKPVLMMNAVRYDMPFCWNKNHSMRSRYHACLQRLHERNQLLVVSNNRADQAYTFMGCGIQPEYIPSLCLYTRMQYAPSKDTFFCYTWHSTEPLPDHPLITKRSGFFFWKELTEYKGIILFPYEVSLMSMFEHFSAGLPMFLPSKEFMRRSHQLTSNSAYWNEDMPEELKSCDADFWIENSDMYTAFASPNTFYFDSVPHLFDLLREFRYTDDTEFRKAYIEKTKLTWLSQLNRLIPNAS